MKSLLAALLLLASSAAALAQTSSVPTLMSYQGHVTDTSGVAIGKDAPTNRTVVFKFYNTSAAGTPLYAESQTVTISGGDFSVLIGNGTGITSLPGPSTPASPVTTLAAVFAANGSVYLGLAVYDAGASTGPEISPRQQIVSAGFALRATVADSVAANALTTGMLNASAVTTAKIADLNVTTAKIADADPVNGKGITTAKIVDGNITTVKIADANVTTGKLADGAVTKDKLGPDSVTGDKILNGTITGADIASNTITSLNLKDGDVATDDLANGAVTTAKIAANNVDYDRLIAAVQQALCPTGTILAYAGDAAPAGWLLCDGTLLSKSSYPALSGLIGTRFGGDTNNFRVPDYRGRFLRGRDGGAGWDPDRASRTAPFPGAAVGDLVGSVQGDMFASHRHAVPTDTRQYNLQGVKNNISQLSLTGTSGSDENFSYDPGTWYEGGNETRPKNAYVNFIIKL